jgi:8-oxo-dGTP pyrophosphatase MutT (NUDIX family)
MSKKRTKRVAICLITDDQDNVLLGKRNDNGKWTVPGGHLDVNEDPHLGACRELKEETGLEAKDVKLIAVEKTPKNTIIYCFKVTLHDDQKIDTSNDPDNECEDWEYLDPNEIKEELHVPIQYNVALKCWINS